MMIYDISGSMVILITATHNNIINPITIANIDNDAALLP